MAAIEYGPGGDPVFRGPDGDLWDEDGLPIEPAQSAEQLARIAYRITSRKWRAEQGDGERFTRAELVEKARLDPEEMKKWVAALRDWEEAYLNRRVTETAARAYFDAHPQSVGERPEEVLRELVGGAYPGPGASAKLDLQTITRVAEEITSGREYRARWRVAGYEIGL